MTAAHVRFGRDTSATLASEVAKRGGRVLVVTGSNTQRFSRLLDSLDAAGLGVQTLGVSGEPNLEWLTQQIENARAFGPEVIVGLGGGSAIDAAKALAALIPNMGNPMRYLEVVGEGLPLEVAPLPMIAVPTTSGTGAEVTKNAVISVPSHRRKVSLRDDRMLPDLAIIDPVLTIGLPLGITAATGLDALTQVIEPYLSSKANPMTDALCREAIKRATYALPRLLNGSDDISLREDMSLASVFGGMALANSGLGAVHGLAGVLGGWCGAPHGALCGRLLPVVLEANSVAIRGNAGFEGRFREVAKWLTGDTDLRAAVRHLETLLEQGKVPRLAEMGLLAADIPEVAEAARLSSSMTGNPAPLNQSTLEDILRCAL